MQSETNILSYFSNWIEKEIGMVFREDQYFQLKNRLDAVCSSFRFEDLNAFKEATKKGLPSEIKTALLDISTNNETSFFRDKKVFNYILNEVIASLVKQNININIWSVASSSGQEAYSLAMLFEEWVEKNKKLVNYKIDGTDISKAILARATEACYSQLEVQRGLPTKLMIKYFDKTDNERQPWKVKEMIRRRTHFSHLNLIDPFRMSKTYDLVLCRNVLIYQTQDKKKEILKRVCEHLRPGGYLIMGSGETPHGINDQFETILKDGALVFRKKNENQEQKAA